MSSDGVPVQIALPFRGVAMTPPVSAVGFLEDTRMPQLLEYAGDSRARQDFSKSLTSWVYPEVLSNDRLWRSGVFRNTASPFIELESLLVHDPGVYLGCGGPEPLMRSIGLPVLSSWGSCGGQQKPMSCPGSAVPAHWSYYSEGVFSVQLRVSSDLIGHPELAQERMASYCLALPTLAGGAVLMSLRWRLNLLSLGDLDARSLGIPVGALRWAVIILVSVIVAAQVAVSGIVAWVGLVIPHCARMLVGPDHRRLLPTAALLGALFVLGLDDISRSSVQLHLPVGVLSALAGTPLVCFLLWRSQGRGWGRE